MIRIKYLIENSIHIDYSKSVERDIFKISKAFDTYMNNNGIKYTLMSIKIIRDRKIKGTSKLTTLVFD